MKQFQNKKVVSAVLAVTMAVTGIQVPVLAAENQTENTDKEEVVYVNLNYDGTVKEINVVNILKPDSTGAIIDYGDYESVRNMTTTDAVDYSGDTVKINTDADKLYYEGKLKSTVMPWNVSIHYYMDGKEYSADDIAGMSGQFKMTMKISENKDYKGNFYDAYALQASVTLDTDQCKNIDAPNATIANVGKNKQLTYTILPGKGAELTITADVTDFEMDDIAVNGIPLSLDIDIDDDELMDQVTELQDGIADADDGAGKLKDGTGELKDGTDTLTSGTSSLASGAETLDAGVQSLNEGIEQIQAGLDALDAKSGELTGGSAQMRQALAQLQAALNSVSASAEDVQKLTTASSQIKTGIDSLSTGADQLAASASYEAYKQVMAANGLDIDALKAGNTEAISSIQAMVDKADSLEAQLKKLGISTDAITPIKEQCEELASQMQILLKGNNVAIEGTEAYMNELHTGAQELADGAADLKKNYSTFNDAVGELADNLTGLIYNMSELKDAVNELAAEYSKLDDGLNVYTEGVAAVDQGYSQLSKGAVSLAAGSSELTKGSQSLYSGAQELTNGASTLYDGTGELKDGMSEMRDKTADMDTKITDQIDDMLDSMTGKNVETGSFVSKQDTNVEKVQFVIKTDSIEKPEEQETAQTEEVQESLWQKLTDLFKK